MRCRVTIYTEGGSIWCCPREAGNFGYCPVHIPQHLYLIKYTWPPSRKFPEGKVRYRSNNYLTRDPKGASLYTFEEAEDIVHNKSRDARLIWDIITTKEPVS